VDDEAAVANVCRMALERGGFRVQVCSGGQLALDLCKTNRFDLILLDVMMPDIDGVEVLRRVRQFDDVAKVVLMTGNASENVEARLKEWSDVVVLSKPMMPKEILEVARRQLAT
jgi:DNA-binding response OmpR family regulator